jgi:hypothetical protein
MGLSYIKVYLDFIDIARALDNGARGRLFMALLEYANGEEVDYLTGAEKIAFLTLKGQIDRDRASYNEISEKRSAAGVRGAEKRWKTKASAICHKANDSKNSKCQQDKDEEKDKDKDKEDIRGKSTRFIPPTYEQVAEYCLSRGNGINPQRFIDFYQSKGWMVGKNKMKDWKAAVRTWESKEVRTPVMRAIPRDEDYDDPDNFVLSI